MGPGSTWNPLVEKWVIKWLCGHNGHCTNLIVDKNLRISVATVTRDSLLDHILTWSFSFGTRWLSISLRIFSLWSFTYNFVQNVQVLVRTRSLIELQNQNIFCIQVKLIIKSMVICCCLSPPHRWKICQALILHLFHNVHHNKEMNQINCSLNALGQG